MESSFDLLDLRSGNLIGSYATEDEAAEVVRRAYETFGPPLVTGLALLRVGEDDEALVAEGLGLARRVMGPVLLSAKPISRTTSTPATVSAIPVAGRVAERWAGGWHYSFGRVREATGLTPGRRG